MLDIRKVTKVLNILLLFCYMFLLHVSTTFYCHILLPHSTVTFYCHILLSHSTTHSTAILLHILLLKPVLLQDAWGDTKFWFPHALVPIHHFYEGCIMQVSVGDLCRFPLVSSLYSQVLYKIIFFNGYEVL